MRQDIAALVSGLNSLRQDVAKLTQDVTKLTIGVARIEGRVSQMPTMIQFVTLIVTLTFAIWGMAFATLRFAGH